MSASSQSHELLLTRDDEVVIIFPWDVELDSSLLDLVTMLIRCTFLGTSIDARLVRCLVSFRAVCLDCSIP